MSAADTAERNALQLLDSSPMWKLLRTHSPEIRMSPNDTTYYIRFLSLSSLILSFQSCLLDDAPSSLQRGVEGDATMESPGDRGEGKLKEGRGTFGRRF